MPKTNLEAFPKRPKMGLAEALTLWRRQENANELVRRARREDELEALVRSILRGKRYEELYAVARHIAAERGIEVNS